MPSKTTHYRRLKRAKELGCSVDELPDLRGKHKNHVRGPSHHKWNETLIDEKGYKLVRVGLTHPLADPNGYAHEHLLVWCAAGNPKPKDDEVLHHKNEKKTDNRYGNIELKKRYDHSVHHYSNISDEVVFQIRTLYSSGGADMPSLATRFDIPLQRISKMIRGETRLKAGGPISLKDHRVGKKTAGRILDGRTWDELPTTEGACS